MERGKETIVQKRQKWKTKKNEKTDGRSAYGEERSEKKNEKNTEKSVRITNLGNSLIVT